MILDVRFPYTAAVRGPGQRKSRAKDFVGSVPVEIRELSAHEAPVALRCEGDEPEEVRLLRWDGDRLYEAMAEDDGPPFDAAWLREQSLNGWEGGRRFVSDTDGYRDAFDGTPEQDPSVARVDSDDMLDRMGSVRERLSDLLLIDGVVHRSVPEPVYHVEHGGLRERADGRSLKIDAYKGWSVSGGMDYRADELDHMLATNRIKDWCSQRRIVVIIPEAVRAPAPESALAKAGESLLKRLGEAVLGQDVGFFARYAVLRDALNAYERDMARVGHDPGHPDAPTVGDLVQAMTDSIPGIPEDVGREMESTVKRALMAVERLDARAFAQLHIPA